jgi:hypothetical protein
LQTNRKGIAMNLIFKSAATVALFASASAPAYAGIAIEAGAAEINDQFGIEMGAGYEVPIALGLKFTPMGGMFIYDNKSIPDGNSDVCTFIQGNVQVVDDNCQDVKFYGAGEVTYSTPLNVTVGAGAMYIDKDVIPYGTASFSILGGLSVKGKLGKDYVAGGLRLSF